MTRKQLFDVAVMAAPPARTFLGYERDLRAAANRHLVAARLLVTDPPLLIEAMFHARMAAECMLKHLFCLLRLARGFPADALSEFAPLKLARDFGHNVKGLGVALSRAPELGVSRALVDITRLFPPGENWNQERYAVSSPSDRDDFDEFVGVLDRLVADVDYGVENV